MMNIRLLVGGFIAGCLLHATAGAAPSTDALLQKELGQQQLRTRTQTVSAQLGTIIAEYERNGIGGEDVPMLKAIQSVLSRLSDDQMQRVVTLLQQAREVTDPNATRRRTLDAFAAQKGILVQMHQLLIEYQRQQSLVELATRFSELALRQNSNLRETVALAKLAPVNQQITDEGQHTALELQRTEQTSLKDEAAPVLAKLAAVAKESAGMTDDRAARALQRATDSKLAESLAAASADLESGRLLSAAGSEKIARDRLREIGRLLGAPKDKEAAVRQALAEVEDTQRQQAKLAEQTESLREDKTSTAAAEDRQADLVDKADQVRKSVESVAPDAAHDLKKAGDEMQNARTALGDGQPAKATPAQNEALKNLAAAHDKLQGQLAKTDKPEDKPQDKLAALKKLQQDTAELKKQQDQLRQAAATSKTDQKTRQEQALKQDDLKSTADKLEQQAAMPAPDAAQSLQEAAQQMEKAAAQLAQQQPADPAQAAAAAALENAQQQLADAAKKADDAQKALAAAENIAKQIEQLTQAQEKLEAQTAQAEANPTGAPMQTMAAQQTQLGQQAGELQKQAAPMNAEAAKNLAAAQNQMGDAAMNLNRENAATAKTAEKAALENLAKAEAALQQQAQNLQAELGQQPPAPDPQAMAQAAEQIAEAQKDAAQAQNEMQNGQMPEAAQALNAAQHAAGAAHHGSHAGMPHSANQALAQAQAALADAAAQAAANQPAPAQENAAQAQQALAQAQAAMAMAQAGMQAQGQGQHPGEGQHQGQGQHPGTKPGSEHKTGTGNEGNWTGTGDGSAPTEQAKKGGQFIGLPARDRMAIQQSQSEKYPQEYGPQIEQYLKNLADTPEGGK